MNEKLTKAPDEGRYIKQLYLNNMHLLESDAKDKRNQWAKKAVHLDKRMMAYLRKQIERLESWAPIFKAETPQYQ